MKIRKLIEVKQDSLIVCDNPKCDFDIPYMPNVDTRWFINKPCPRCGENLLTPEDHFQHEKMIQVVNWLNKWFSWITLFIPEKTKGETVRVYTHNGIKIERNEK